MNTTGNTISSCWIQQLIEQTGNQYRSGISLSEIAITFGHHLKRNDNELIVSQNEILHVRTKKDPNGGYKIENESKRRKPNEGIHFQRTKNRSFDDIRLESDLSRNADEKSSHPNFQIDETYAPLATCRSQSDDANSTVVCALFTHTM